MSLLGHASRFLGLLKAKIFKSPSQLQVTRPSLPTAATRDSPWWLMDPIQTQTLREKRLKLLQADAGHHGLEHGIPQLSPPWRFSDLPAAEQWAYVRYGPNYATHEALLREQRRKNKSSLRKRKSSEARYRKTLGPDWYIIYAAAKKLRDSAFHNMKTTSNLPERQMLQDRLGELLRDGATREGTTERDAELRSIEAMLLETERIMYAWFQTKGLLAPYIEKVQKQRAARGELGGTKADGEP